MLNYRLNSALLAFALCLWLAACAGAVETEKLKVTLSLTSKSGDSGSSTDAAWAMDGTWDFTPTPRQFSLQVNSRYTKSDDGAKFDRLKTWWRYLWKDIPETEWRPLFLISTEGDHGIDQLHTLAAFGYRKNYNRGFIELTAGASKDLQTSEAWVGDIGALVSYEKQWGKLSWGLNPQGELGVLGDVRYRDDRFRYNVDTDLGYKIGDRLRATYQLTFGNTTADSRRTQFIGITYER